MNPLIVTALLDEEVQARFDELRRLHFPPERNYIDAHVTLFHALPGVHEASILAAIQESLPAEPISVSIAKVILLGGGVGFRLESPSLMQLRSTLAAGWSEWLTPQDRQKSELHVTVQNKVHAASARQLHAELSEAFEPSETQCRGLALWRYMDGPWSPVKEFVFGSSAIG